MIHRKTIALLFLVITFATMPVMATTKYIRDFRGSINIEATNSLLENLEENDEGLSFNVDNPDSEFAVENIFYDTYEYRTFNLDYVIFRDPLKGDIYTESGTFSRDAMNQLNAYLDANWSRNISEDESAITVKGKISDRGWVRLRCCDNEDGDTYIYVNVSDKGVFRILLYEVYDEFDEPIVFSDKALKSVDKIVESITDDGEYEQVLLARYEGNPEQWEEAEDEADVDLMFICFSIIAAIASPIIAAVADKNKEKTNKSKGVKADRIQGKRVVVDQKKEKTDYSKAIPVKSKTLIPDAVTTNRDQINRYVEDLKVLLKSGLLTQTEYDEMVNKHRRL